MILTWILKRPTTILCILPFMHWFRIKTESWWLSFSALEQAWGSTLPKREERSVRDFLFVFSHVEQHSVDASQLLCVVPKQRTRILILRRIPRNIIHPVVTVEEYKCGSVTPQVRKYIFIYCNNSEEFTSESERNIESEIWFIRTLIPDESGKCVLVWILPSAVNCQGFTHIPEERQAGRQKELYLRQYPLPGKYYYSTSSSLKALFANPLLVAE